MLCFFFFFFLKNMLFSSLLLASTNDYVIQLYVSKPTVNEKHFVEFSFALEFFNMHMG